ncbi:SLOG family protein [Sporosarcina ureilytica]|uniref:SLOG family protein n=1 Tax=Sporosarcina ureilytica TaxID=298596 RepID=UPI0009E33238|nr:DUF1273 domain-containing protein [Sporosarcina ureilytica]
MDVKRVFVTGYKQHELGIFDDKHPGISIIKKALKSQFISLIPDGLEWIIVSGQLGVELWATEVILELQEEYPQLKYAVITPFIDQEQNWNDANKEKYQSMLVHADYQVSLTSTPYEAPWQFTEKDKFLIRNSDGMVLVYDAENEGSPKFVKRLVERYMETADYQLITITADDLNFIAEEEQLKEWYE